MKLVSREYKVMLDHSRFGDRQAAQEALWGEIEDLARAAPSTRSQGNLDRKEKRTVVFLDTPDLNLRRNGLVLRRRQGDDGVQYSIKCRSEDRYFAAGTDLSASPGIKSDVKLEEDIAPPFLCRFSHSNTLTFRDESQMKAMPGTLGEAGAMFPILGTLSPEDTALRPVNDITAFERVYTGAKLVFGGLGPQPDEDASVALILWSDGKAGSPMVAEFSFRLKNRKERFTRALVAAARAFFEALQQLDWCRPDAMTKTEFIYRDTGGD